MDSPPSTYLDNSCDFGQRFGVLWEGTHKREPTHRNSILRLKPADILSDQCLATTLPLCSNPPQTIPDHDVHVFITNLDIISPFKYLSSIVIKVCVFRPACIKIVRHVDTRCTKSVKLSLQAQMSNVKHFKRSQEVTLRKLIIQPCLYILGQISYCRFVSLSPAPASMLYFIPLPWLLSILFF